MGLITRLVDTDDNGTGTTGTVHNNAWLQTLQDKMDAAYQGGQKLNATLAITDSLSHNITAVNNLSGYITIVAGGQVTAIPFWTNGGAGVAYRWTFLNPGTGWTINGYGTFSFTDAGNINTYSVTFNDANGELSIQRTAGTTNYTITVYAQ